MNYFMQFIRLNSKPSPDAAIVTNLTSLPGAGFPDLITQFSMSFWLYQSSANQALNIFNLTSQDDSSVGIDIRFFGLWARISLNHDDINFGAWSYDTPTIIAPTLTSVLIAFDAATQTIQFYINDAPMPLQTGGATPQTVPGVNNLGLTWQLYLYPNEDFAVETGLGDFWVDNQFIDFSVEANRRKFINADLTPANLGTHGQSPTGIAPIIFLTARDNTNSFSNNYGTGGHWIVNNGPLVSFPPPPPSHPSSKPPFRPVDYELLLTDAFRENPFWTDFTKSMTDLFNPNLHYPIEALAQIRSITVEPYYAGLNLQMVGFRAPLLSFTPDEYKRLMKNIGRFIQTRGASVKFLDFIGFIKDIKFTMIPLWANDITNINSLSQDPPLPGTEIWNGGAWFPTSFYDVSYDGNLPLNETQLKTLLQILEPIHLVFRQLTGIFADTTTIQINPYALDVIHNFSRASRFVTD